MFDGIIPIAIILKIRKQYITLRILQAVATFKSQLQNTIDLIISFRGLFSSELLRPLGRWTKFSCISGFSPLIYLWAKATPNFASILPWRAGQFIIQIAMILKTSKIYAFKEFKISRNFSKLQLLENKRLSREL